MYTNLESLIMQAANGQDFDEQLDNVTIFYKANFDRALLSTQLLNHGTWFADREPKKGGRVAVCGTSPSLSQLQNSFCCKVC